jgi:hypothetical protein
MAETHPSWATAGTFTLKGRANAHSEEWGLASDLLGEQSPANTLFVILEKEGDAPHIEAAHWLELDTPVHGLFSFAELGFTNEQVAEYFNLQETAETLQDAVDEARGTLADSVAEMIRHRGAVSRGARDLDVDTLAGGFRILTMRAFHTDLEKLRHTIDGCTALQEAIQVKLVDIRASALAAVAASHKPTMFPLSIKTFLRLRANMSNE